MSQIGAKLNQAVAHIQGGRLEQARQSLQRTLQQAPGNPDACSLMSVVLLRLGQWEQALFFSQRAIEARPDDANALVNHGNALSLLKRPDEARRVFDRALTINPDLLPARQGLINLFRDDGEYSAAAAQLEYCLARAPADPAFNATYAAVLTNLARARESVAFARRAVAANPRDLLTGSMLGNAINYDETATPEQAFEAHAAFGRALAAAVPASTRPFANPRDPDRTLRVGLLSSDLRRHSVAHFLEPLLSNLDRGRLAVVAYASNREDEVSARFKSLVPEWRNVALVDDAKVAEQIRADRIDVLIETSGLTRGHRLAVMARREAPVQVTFAGYPNTTGLPAIDYRIVDSSTDPPGAERFCVERPARLDPCFLCYQPPAGEAASPARSGGGPFTFASFNAAMKINDPLLALWSRLLSAAPGSRLILKAFDFRDAPLREQVLARLAAAGADPSRVEILPPLDDAAAHLDLYRRVDLALDTFPYNGTTTTCEALWMGVPVVSLAGQTHASRVGLSLLSAVGLRELAAGTPDAYVTIAAGLATDRDRLATLRTGLRERLLSSPLCDGPGYARRFGALIRTMWRAWCAA